jgi:hypothetical protein
MRSRISLRTGSKCLAFSSLALLVCSHSFVAASQDPLRKFVGDKLKAKGVDLTTAYGNMPPSYNRRPLLQRCIEWLAGTDESSVIKQVYSRLASKIDSIQIPALETA